MTTKYATGKYLIYYFNKVGGRMKDTTEEANSYTEASKKGHLMVENHEAISSYVVLRVIINSAED